MPPKYPNITVQLSGQNGNAFVILGLCRLAARRAKLPAGEISDFIEEAKSGDYEHLLQTCMKWFVIE